MNETTASGDARATGEIDLRALLQIALDGSLDALGRRRQFCDATISDGRISWCATTRTWICSIFKDKQIGFYESSGPHTAVKQACLMALGEWKKRQSADESAQSKDGPRSPSAATGEGENVRS
jgi:hypothetical protein